MIEYRRTTRTAALTASLSTTATISRRGISLALNIPNPAAGLTLTFYGCATATGTFKIIRRRTSADTDWTAWENITLGGIGTSDGGIYRIPDECLDVPFLRIVATESISVGVFELGTGDVKAE